MKFAALLRHSAEDLPELSELFRSYKQLKKRLKTLPQRCNNPAARLSLTEISQREAIFVRAIIQNVQSFNDTFLDREENAVIQLRTLEDAQVAARPDRVQVVYRGFVNLHGRLLLMVQWSLLAYTGICKILKKHHKRTGLLVMAPQLQNLLAQPFCSIELASQLVRKAEVACERLALQLREAPAAAGPRVMRLPHGLSQKLHSVTQQAIARSQGSLVAASVSLQSTTSSGSSLITSSSSMSASLSASSSGSLSDSPSAPTSASPSASAPLGRSRSCHAAGGTAGVRFAAAQRRMLHDVSSAHVVPSRTETVTQHHHLWHARRQSPDTSAAGHRAQSCDHTGLSHPQDPTPAPPCTPGSAPAPRKCQSDQAAAVEASGEAATQQQQHSQLREGIAGARIPSAGAAAEAGARTTDVQLRQHHHGVKRAHGLDPPCAGSPSTHRPHKHHAPAKSQDAWQRSALEATATLTEASAYLLLPSDLQQSSQQQLQQLHASLPANVFCSTSQTAHASRNAEPLCGRVQPGAASDSQLQLPQQLAQAQVRPDASAAADADEQHPRWQQQMSQFSDPPNKEVQLGQQQSEAQPAADQPEPSPAATGSHPDSHHSQHGGPHRHDPTHHHRSQYGQQQAGVQPAAEQSGHISAATVEPTSHRHPSQHGGAHRHHPTHHHRSQHGQQQAGVQPAAGQSARISAATVEPTSHRHHSQHGAPQRHHPTTHHRHQHGRHRGHSHQQPSSVMRQTQVALGMWQQMQATAVTPSIVLPPVGTHPALAASISSGESGT